MASLYKPASLYIAPTIVIGLGGTGVETMRRIKARVKYSMSPTPGIIEFLALDTEPRPNPPGVERISEREYAYIGDYNATRVLKNLEAHPHIKDWWFDETDVVTGSIHKGARQRRPVGRLSLYVNWGKFAQPFNRKARQIREIAKKEEVQHRGANVERGTGVVKVYIIASVCGGTGSGIFLDVAFRVRAEFGDNADIVGVFLLPSCFLPELQSVKQKQRIQANAYAALQELNHFMKGKDFEASFPEQPYRDGSGSKMSTTLNRPFDGVYLVDRSNGKEYISSLDSAYSMVAQQVFLDIVSPIGQRLAARRSNLLDLAGETSRAGGDTNPQPLFVGTFVTASLVLPADEIITSATALYSANFIRNNVIGRSFSPTRELSDELDARFRAIDDALRFEKVSSTRRATGTISERLRGTAPGGSIREIDLTLFRDAMQKTLSTLRDNLNSDFHHHCLQGVHHIVQSMTGRVRERLEEIEEEIKHLGQDRDTIKNSLQAQPPSENILQKGLDIVAGVFSQGSTLSQRRRLEWQKQQSELAQQLRTVETKRAREEQSRTALTQLETVFNDIKAELEARINTLSNLAEQLSETTNQEGLRSSAAGANSMPQRGMDLFELATEVGWESYGGVMNGREFEASFLELHPQDMAANRPFSSEVEDTMVKEFGESFFNLSLETTSDRNVTLKLLPVPDQAATVLQRRLQNSFAGYLDRPGRQKGLNIIKYLDWFHKHVQYDHGSSRYSPIDPLQMLRDRCQLPFLEIEPSRLGTEGAADTEDVRLIGTGTEREKDPVAQVVLEDFDAFEDVITGVLHRLDISFSRHGYPIRVLRSLCDFKRNYKHFYEFLGEKLHIHRDWPADMDDLLDEGAC